MMIRGVIFLALLVQCPLSAQAADDEPERAAARPARPSGSPSQQEPPQPRRRVPAIVPPTVTPPGSTTLWPMSRPSTTQPSRPAPSMQPDRPATVTGCDPVGCWDGSGNRYNSGGGTTYLNKAGKLCTRNGAWMQCF
ncbi:hypothetical protein EDC30_104323 [Paucimonas lemoignei]|uniref:Lipoprotein n=1 Tax=Paucimonas lemoignei TaxID=29443 RepID=A0A4R3I107_PAULE|nr:hypothetical protein [Paucimonas lemoignei]TCS37519.1 hypothetical protein EDC30_104323 [Paucimonas lemoignei]